MTNKAIKIKGLFLDDERYPQDVTWIKYPDNIEWTIVRSFQDFSLEMTHGDNDYYVYSFDHDIQSYIDGREYTHSFTSTVRIRQARRIWKVTIKTILNS